MKRQIPLLGSVKILTGRNDMNRTIGSKLHNAVALGEKGKIVAPTHKKAGAELRAPLADKDASGADQLTPVRLDSQPLGILITTVGGTALTFCMRHFVLSGRYPITLRRRFL